MYSGFAHRIGVELAREHQQAMSPRLVEVVHVHPNKLGRDPSQLAHGFQLRRICGPPGIANTSYPPFVAESGVRREGMKQSTSSRVQIERCAREGLCLQKIVVDPGAEGGSGGVFVYAIELAGGVDGTTQKHKRWNDQLLFQASFDPKANSHEVRVQGVFAHGQDPQRAEREASAARASCASAGCTCSAVRARSQAFAPQHERTGRSRITHCRSMVACGVFGDALAALPHSRSPHRNSRRSKSQKSRTMESRWPPGAASST